MRITQGEIAERVGVSQVTVSKVLNKSRAARISPDKRREIVALSRQLGYQPRNITTHAIGYALRVNVMGMEGEIQTLKELQVALSARGYRLVLADIDERHPAQLRQALNAKTVDGVIFSQWPRSDIRELLPPEVPFVVTAAVDGVGPDMDQVVIDFFQSSQLMTEHLLQKGHRRICFVTGLIDISVHRHVREGFYAAFKNAAVPASQGSLIEVSDANDIEPLLHREMQKSQPPTAILGLEFLRVANAVNYLQTAGYRVPQDVSLASIADSKEYGWLRPAVTSTSANGKDVAAQAAKRLLEKIENPDIAHKKVVIPSHLIERASVMPPTT